MHIAPEGSYTDKYNNPSLLDSQNISCVSPTVSITGSPMNALAKYLAGQMEPWVGNSEFHVKNTRPFVHKVDSIQVLPTDLFVKSWCGLLVYLCPLMWDSAIIKASV